MKNVKVLIAILSMFFAMIVAYQIYKKDTPTSFVNEKMSGIEQRFEEIINSISTNKICSYITPVLIYREEGTNLIFHATGGMVDLDSTIITAGHAFWNLSNTRMKPWRYYYRILQPIENGYKPINRVMEINMFQQNGQRALEDIIICIPGNSQLITPVINPLSDIDGSLFFDYYASYEKKLVVRSTVTGKQVHILGYAQVANGGPSLFVMDYDIFPGQSGTIFVGNDENTLYIISRSLRVTDELRKVFGLPNNTKGVSLCSAVEFRPK